MLQVEIQNSKCLVQMEQRDGVVVGKEAGMTLVETGEANVEAIKHLRTMISYSV